MADLFLIKGETLKSTADKIREYLGLENYSIDNYVVADSRAIKWFETDSVLVMYREMIDDPSGCYDDGFGAPFGDAIVAYTYLENNEGNIIPVLYKTSESHAAPDTQEPFFYEGKAGIDGETFDKWRKIETNSLGDGFTWDSEAKQYIYTNPIVTVHSNVDGIVPYYFPSKIDDVYEAGYAKGQASGEGESMLGTWVFNDEITLPNEDMFFSFSNDRNNEEGILTTYQFNRIYTNGVVISYYGDDVAFDDVYEIPYGWSENGYKKITILEAPSAEAAAWIKASAKKKGYEEGYDEGYDKGFADNAPSTPTDNRTTLKNWYQYLADGYYYDLSAGKLVDDDWEDPVPIELKYPTGTQNLTSVMRLARIYVSVGDTIADGNGDDVDVYAECTLPVSKFTGTLDVASCSSLNYTFQSLEFLEDAGEIINTDHISTFTGTFIGCSALTTTPELDVRNGTTFTNMFSGCTNLTDIRLRNIKANLTVSNDLLTVDSLVHLIYELRKTNSTIKTLSMGSANLKKLANVYVKRITVTDEMRAEDDLIDQKLPFVVCESTDEGAMLITNYVLSKYWKLS